MPARYGVAFALRASTVVHVVTFALFVWFGALVGLGWLWWIGLALTAVAFVYEHAIVTPTDLSRVNRAFFTANGFVGIALFVFALLDLVVRLGLRRLGSHAYAVGRRRLRRLRHAVRRRRPARTARRRRARSTWWSPGRPG